MRRVALVGATRMPDVC